MSNSTPRDTPIARETRKRVEEAMSGIWYVERQCEECDKHFKYDLTQVEAFRYENWPIGHECPHCGGWSQFVRLYGLREIDEVILEAWYVAEDDTLLGSDADLRLAQEPLELLVHFMGDDPGRRRAVGRVLAVKYGDGTVDNVAELDRLGTLLDENRDLWEGLAMEYTQRRVKKRLSERTPE